MIMDSLLEFSDAQALASISDTSSTISTNVSDLGANGEDAWGSAQTMDIGEGGGLVFNAQVVAALVGASAAIVCELTTKAADATLGTSGTNVVSLTIPTISAIGTRVSVRVPTGTIERYIGVLYTASGGNLTSATIDSWIGLDHETSK